MARRHVSSVAEIVTGRLYWASGAVRPSGPHTHIWDMFGDSNAPRFAYWNFFLDFGPLNLGQLYRFCQIMSNKLRDRRYSGNRIVVWAGDNAAHRANSACCLALYSILYLRKTPEEAYRPFKAVSPPFPPFHDASPCVCSYRLTIPHVLSAVYKAKQCNFFDFETFDADEYESFEQVENGDLSWLVQGRFLAFAGPHDTKATTAEGYVTLCPDDYTPHFKRWGVSTVVRLNKAYYDARRFTSKGIAHKHMYYLDGSNAPPEILDDFIRTCEAAKGGIAVHCKAGLGRTGTCVGAYLMKHFRLTAAEVIGWMRICRPGSVIGPQQQYLESLQRPMWAAGDEYRARHGFVQRGTIKLSLPDNVKEMLASAEAADKAKASSSSSRRGAAAASTSALADNMGRVSITKSGSATSDDRSRTPGSESTTPPTPAAAASSSSTRVSSPPRRGAGGAAASSSSAAATTGTGTGRYSGGGSAGEHSAGFSSPPLRSSAAGSLRSPAVTAATTPASTRSDASQGDHLRASRTRTRASPGAGASSSPVRRYA